jgi:hypothetical protein
MRCVIVLPSLIDTSFHPYKVGYDSVTKSGRGTEVPLPCVNALHEHQEIVSAKTCSEPWFVELGRVMLATCFVEFSETGAVAKM